MASHSTKMLLFGAIKVTCAKMQDLGGHTWQKKGSRTLVHEKDFGLIWQVRSKLGYLL